VQKLLAVAQQRGSSPTRDDELYLAIEALTAEDLRRLLVDENAFKDFAEKIGSLSYPTLQPLRVRWYRGGLPSIQKDSRHGRRVWSMVFLPKGISVTYSWRPCSRSTRRKC